MTTKAQIKRLVAPVLARHTDLALVHGRGLIIVVKPVRHFLRAFFIDRTSSADTFRVEWFVSCLFAGPSRPMLSPQGDVYRRSFRRFWQWDDPEMPARFEAAITWEVLPRLRAVTDIAAYEALESSYEPRRDYILGLYAVLAIARGDLDEAARCLDAGYRPWGVAEFNQQRAGLGDRLKAEGSRLSAEDRRTLAEVLHAWEARAVDHLKLAPVWERTPFPLELGDPSA
jgi:hypothetical protein